jgi:GntR family transcriptional regulator
MDETPRERAYAPPMARAQPSAATPRFAPIAPDAAGMPLYRAVARALLRTIEEGALAPGAALPSETRLSASFGVAVGTLRRAVDDLVADHILVRRQGRGTFVATHTRDRFLFQFFHVERGDGLREAPEVELLSFERARMDEEAASALGMQAGDPAFAVQNRLRLQDTVVVHDQLVIPAVLFRGLTEKRLRERPSTLYHLYQNEFGITVVRAHERVRAVAADRASARVLGISPGQALLQVRRTAIALGGRAVEYRTSSVVTTRHDYVNLLSRAA